MQIYSATTVIKATEVTVMTGAIVVIRVNKCPQSFQFFYITYMSTAIAPSYSFKYIFQLSISVGLNLQKNLCCCTVLFSQDKFKYFSNFQSLESLNTTSLENNNPNNFSYTKYSENTCCFTIPSIFLLLLFICQKQVLPMMISSEKYTTKFFYQCNKFK